MIVPYERIAAEPRASDPSPYIDRPILPVYVFGRTGVEPTRAVLDTGSVDTMFSTVFHDAIGPGYLGAPTELHAADGRSFTVVYGRVDLAIRLETGELLKWGAVVAFRDGPRALLGDAGFLRYFTVRFNGPARALTIKPGGRSKFPPPTMPSHPIR